MIGTAGWKVLRGATVVVAVIAAEKGLRTGWQAVTGRKPPPVPEDPHTPWGRPLAWAIVSGALVGATRLVAIRVAASVYEKNAGHLPKAIRQKVEAANAAVSEAE
jgi:hypothetical protein